MANARELTLEEHEYIQTKGADAHLAAYTAARETMDFDAADKVATEAVTRWTDQERKRLQASKPHNRIALRRARRGSRQTFSSTSPALIMSVSGGVRQGGSVAPISLANGDFYAEHNAKCREMAQAVAA
jgi:hypothetical protein